MTHHCMLCQQAIEHWYDVGWVHTGSGLRECDDTFTTFATPAPNDP